MTRHKFSVGSQVDFRLPYAQNRAASGRFVVQRLLPPDGDGNLYRIESPVDGRQRVAHEVNLSAAEG